VSVTVSNLPVSWKNRGAPRLLGHTGHVQPTADEIRAQLDRVLASEGFANADRMSAFLRYVVERALAGESDQIKEYAIGVDVFGRNGSYDPRLDSIVRVEARRLRAKVDEYYATTGGRDPVIIGLRRGTYVPSFERRRDGAESLAAAPAAPAAGEAAAVRQRSLGWQIAIAVLVCTVVLVGIAASRGNLWATGGRPGVSIAVLPFAHYSTDQREALLAARLTDGVTSELARLGTIGVVSHTSARQFAGVRKPASEIAQALHADIVMEGTVTRSGDRVIVTIRLVKAETDRKMWVREFEGRAADPRELERRIATDTAPFVLASAPR
jgi:TolB-like protein